MANWVRAHKAELLWGAGALTAAGALYLLLRKAHASTAYVSPDCYEQPPQDFLIRQNYLKNNGFARAVEYRTIHYGHFPGFGDASMNAHPPSFYAKPVTFFGVPVNGGLHERVIPSLKCIEAAIKQECTSTPYQPKAMSGMRFKNTYHNFEVSNHVYGIALDIDPATNPCCGCVNTHGGVGPDNPICAQPDTGLYSRMSIPECWVHIFERYGWYWLGNDEHLRDKMHFEFLGEPP